MAYSVESFVSDCDMGHEFEFEHKGIGYGIGWNKTGLIVAYRKKSFGLYEQTFSSVDDMLDGFMIDDQPLREIIPMADSITVF